MGGDFFEQRIEKHISDEILFARFSAGFALLALSIACVGLYGTMSYMVARRTGEIRIRMALGAPRGRVVWMTMRQVAALTAIGLLIGVPVAFGASRQARPRRVVHRESTRWSRCDTNTCCARAHRSTRKRRRSRRMTKER